MHVEEQAAAPGGTVRTRGLVGETRFGLGAVIVVALVVGFVAWLVIGRSNTSPSPTANVSVAATTPGGAVGAAGAHLGPVVANGSELATFAKGIKSPVYWAGPLNGYSYELTQTTTGKVFVRYLPSGVKAGDPRASFLIVATYPYPKAFAALKNVAKANALKLPGGGIALVDTGYPKSVHIAFPGAAYQVEVYDPSPARARQVALSGTIKPVH
jgi:hypothetical protein